MIALLLACAAFAQEDAETTWERLAAPATLQAAFSLVQHRHMLSRPLESTGNLAFARPDKVRWSVDAPTSSVFVMDGDDLAMSYPALGVSESLSLHDRPNLTSLVGALTVWLRADLDTARETYAVTLQDGRAQLVPHDPALSRWVSEIELRLSDDRTYVAAMTLTEPDGDRVEIAFSDVRLDAPLDPALFELP